jgi:hypothetical protein
MVLFQMVLFQEKVNETNRSIRKSCTLQVEDSK